MKLLLLLLLLTKVVVVVMEITAAVSSNLGMVISCTGGNLAFLITNKW